MWGSDAVCFLTGFGGFHTGKGETVSAEQYYESGNPTWFLHNQSFDLGKLSYGAATCIKFKNLHASEPYTQPGMPVYYKPTHPWPSYGEAGPLPDPIRLANKYNAFCALGMIGGGFYGSGDSVAISNVDATGRQQLSGTLPQSGKQVSATCLY
jgi:hypothetical protein